LIVAAQMNRILVIRGGAIGDLPHFARSNYCRSGKRI
jgi:hypothetical protein